MIFNSLTFLVFIFVFVLIYYNLKSRPRLYFTLFSSYFFYGWWDWRFLSLILISTLIDFIVARKIELTNSKQTRKRLLALSMISNLGILGFFKYFNFFIDSFNEFMQIFGLHGSSFTLNIILPVGISFYTFQSMSYTIDVYRNGIKAESDFLRFATYIAFFPQLVAGPIVRAVDFLPQLNGNIRFSKTRVLNGLDIVMAGYFKKVVVADSLAPVVDQVFAAPNNFSSIQLIIGVFFYSFQIYCDFSGYSDIAIGIAKILGFKFPQNFNIPYISKNFSEFWRRWHISLSSWLRDYLYISLGGNRRGKMGTYLNNMITMLLGGLWHGANWTFLFWGFLHGFYLILQRLIISIRQRIGLYSSNGVFRLLDVTVSVTTVYLFTCIAWIFFRSQTIGDAFDYLSRILTFNNMSFDTLVNKFWIVKGFFLIAILIIGEILYKKFNLFIRIRKTYLTRVFYYAVVLWMISFFGTFSSNQFIYFQF